MGDQLIIEGSEGERAVLSPLRVITDARGEVRHVLKASDGLFLSFGEAYFTSVNPGVIKGWKKHKRMQMHLVVPIGSVCFFLRTERPCALKSVVVGNSQYQRLVVDPGIWVAFKALGDNPNLILNVASHEHDPNEAVNMELSAFSLE